MKLFVWDEFAPDYSDGLAFAIAESETQARELIVDKHGYPPDVWGNVQVFELNNPIAFCVSGKG